MCAEREKDNFITRLMQGEFNLHPMEYAPTLKIGDLSGMCTDLETQADSYAVFISRGLDPECSTADVVRQKLAEAYKQGYMDANALVCCNRKCNQRIPPRPYRVGDKVTVTFPNGNKMTGHIAEVKWGGWCDIDFGNGCMRYDVPPCEIELLETD